MRHGQILLGLHLSEPRLRAQELELELVANVELCLRHGGGDDQLYAAVVELIDQIDEAACGVFTVGVELRDA